MAQEYASKQPQGFKNHIEKVAIVGVSWVLLQGPIFTLALNSGAYFPRRQAAKLANSLQRLCLRPESTKSLLLLARIARASYPQVWRSRKSITTTNLPLSRRFKAKRSSLLQWRSPHRETRRPSSSRPPQ